MRTTNRAYCEENGDFSLVSRLLIEEESSHLRELSTWCLGRFADWKYGLYDNKVSTPGFWGKNARLWFDGFGNLAGMAISENGDGGFAIITASGYRFLFEELLVWVLANWRGRGPNLSIEITENQDWESRILERYGFQPTSSFFTRHFDLTLPLPTRYPLEEGFEIVDMASHPDYRAQRLLRADAFQNKNSLSDEELTQDLLRTEYGHTSPIYHAYTDLCVKASDGQLVSGCEALIDAKNRVADVERVCTHRDFRRRGFARAVIQECLYRLKAMGIESAYITGYNPGAVSLYGSLGAKEEIRHQVYANN